MRATGRSLGREVAVDALGQPRHGAVDAAGAVVGGEGEARPVALLPQLEQRGREQRQRPGLALDVGDQRVDERGVDPQAGALGGQHDRAPQLVAAHRPDRHVVGAEHAPQLGVARAAAVEVGAQRDQHERAAARVAHGGDERGGERGPLGLVAAGGEQLLELVDGDHEPARGRRLRDRVLERGERVGAGAEERDRPAVAAGQHAVGERGQQAGLQRRRLAAAGGADDAEQRRARQPRDHLGDQPLAAEEDVGVVDLEAARGP